MQHLKSVITVVRKTFGKMCLGMISEYFLYLHTLEEAKKINKTYCNYLTVNLCCPVAV